MAYQKTYLLVQQFGAKKQTNCGFCGKSMKLGTKVAFFELNKSGYGPTQNNSKWRQNSRWRPEGLKMQLNWRKTVCFCDNNMKIGTHKAFFTLNKSWYRPIENNSKWRRNSRWRPEGLKMQLNWRKTACFCDNNMKIGTHKAFFTLNKSWYRPTENNSKWRRNSRWRPEGLQVLLGCRTLACFVIIAWKLVHLNHFPSFTNLGIDPAKAIQNGGKIQDGGQKA